MTSPRKKAKRAKPVRRSMSPEREAEELRAGIEKIIEEKGELVRDMVAFDADELAVKASDLRELLDRVDARDSLKHLERKAKRQRARAGGAK